MSNPTLFGPKKCQVRHFFVGKNAKFGNNEAMKREIFNDLKKWKEDKRRKPLILKGVRQVGKTFILDEFGRKSFANTHYLNFEKNKSLFPIFEESLDPQQIIQKLNFKLDTRINLQEDLLIFDEIQECPKALTSLKYFAEEMSEMAVCAAGSLLGLHLGPVSFPVGKVNILHMTPMSFREFLMALDEKQALNFLDEAQTTLSIPEIVHDHLWERLKWYFITGGLPEVVETFVSNRENLFQAFVSVRKLQQELILSYLADMAKHSGKINSMHIDRLWRSIPDQLARSQDASAKKFVFKDVGPGINRFDRAVGVLDWLQKASLIIKVDIVNSGQLPFSAYSKENAFKLFLFDVGILGALSDLEPRIILEQTYGSYKGYFAENFVAQEFLCSGLQHLYSWQEKSAEVEFVCQADGQVIPIEVKSGGVTRAKSLHVFASKYHSPFRVIVSANNLSQANSQVRYYPLYMASDLIKSFRMPV